MTPVQTAEALRDSTIDRFWETIPPVWNSIRANVRGIASDQFGVSVEQFHILRHIRKGVSSVSELAEIRQISRPAVSQAVELLVEKGLVTRAPETQDRRYVRLVLTRTGDRLLNAVFEKNRAWMKDKMAPLRAADHETILHGLTLLGTIFGERTPSSPRKVLTP